MTAFYTIASIANYFGVHPATVRKMIDRGELKTVRIGRRERISAAELRRYTGTVEVPENSTTGTNENVTNDSIL